MMMLAAQSFWFWRGPVCPFHLSPVPLELYLRHHCPAQGHEMCTYFLPGILGPALYWSVTPCQFSYTAWGSIALTLLRRDIQQNQHCSKTVLPQGKVSAPPWTQRSLWALCSAPLSAHPCLGFGFSIHLILWNPILYPALNTLGHTQTHARTGTHTYRCIHVGRRPPQG